MSSLADPERELWSRPPAYPATLVNMARRTLKQHPDKVAFIYGDRRLTFGEIGQQADALAKALLADGVGKGSRVGILLPNSPDWLISFLAVTQIGAIAVLISTMYQRKELAWLLQHADIAVLLLADRYLSHDYVMRLQEIAPDLDGQEAGQVLSVAELPYLRHVYVFGETAPTWANHWTAGSAPPRGRISDAVLASVKESVTPADLALMMYTSGSTADPKGVLHTHSAVVNRLHKVHGWSRVSLEDRLLVIGPFCWAGRFIALMQSLRTGATVICARTPKLNDIVDMMIRERPTRITAQENLVRELRQHPRVVSGELGPELVAIVEPRDENGELYAPGRKASGVGMTETFGQHSFELEGLIPADKVGASGRAALDMEREIRDPETGVKLGPTEVGELWVRSPNMMAGMYKRDRAEVFASDGFYNTGDLCRIDEDGYLYFVGRNNDMIKTSGANVSPTEVEKAIEQLPEIQEVGVFSLPGEGHDQKVAAVVVVKAGAAIDAEEIRARLKAAVATFKVPKVIHFSRYEDLPRTHSGKLNKRIYRAELLERMAKAAPELAGQDR